MLTKNQLDRTPDERPTVENGDTRRCRDAQKISPILHPKSPPSRPSKLISTVQNEEQYVSYLLTKFQPERSSDHRPIAGNVEQGQI